MILYFIKLLILNQIIYKNSDASNNFNYALSNKNSGQINFFSLSILDQDLNLLMI